MSTPSADGLLQVVYAVCWLDYLWLLINWLLCVGKKRGNKKDFTLL